MSGGDAAHAVGDGAFPGLERGLGVELHELRRGVVERDGKAQAFAGLEIERGSALEFDGDFASREKLDVVFEMRRGAAELARRSGDGIGGDAAERAAEIRERAPFDFGVSDGA